MFFFEPLSIVLWLVAGCIACIGYYIYTHTKYGQWTGKTRIVRGIPLFGVAPFGDFTHEAFFQMLQIYTVCRKLREKMITIHLSIFKHYVVYTPDATEELIASQHLNKKSYQYDMLGAWLQKGLLTSEDKKWFQRRKLITPSFHFKILEKFVDIFNEQSRILISVLRDNESSSEKFDILSYITLCTLDIVCETSMGVRINAQTNKKSEYVTALSELTDVIEYRMFHYWLYPELIYQLSKYGRKQRQCLAYLHKFTEKVIADRRESIKNDNVDFSENNIDSIYLGKSKNRLAFLDLLITASDNGKTMSDLDIREEVDTFMFEGHDTTALAISWCIYLLACDPKCQKKVHDELDEVFGDSDRFVTPEDLPKLKYLEMCIKETLRLFPSVILFARTARADIIMSDGSRVTDNSTVAFYPGVIHRDRRWYPNPEVFDPERFHPDAPARNPYAYVPFSAGQRNCIGQKFAIMEEKVVLATFFRNFAVEPRIAREDIVLLHTLLLRPQGGLPIKIKSRC